MSICSNASWKALIIPARSCPGSPEKAGVGGSIPSLATIEITCSCSGNNLQLPRWQTTPTSSRPAVSICRATDTLAYGVPPIGQSTQRTRMSCYWQETVRPRLCPSSHDFRECSSCSLAVQDAFSCPVDHADYFSSELRSAEFLQPPFGFLSIEPLWISVILRRRYQVPDLAQVRVDPDHSFPRTHPAGLAMLVGDEGSALN
jgi:hypothetical protein